MLEIPQWLLGKWFAEGKGKGLWAEYPDREPALVARNVLAFRKEGSPWNQKRWHRRY
jgi:hypothetical protein